MLVRISNARHAACGITHLPDFELIGGDVVENRLLLLLDCFLQVADSLRMQDVDRKGVCIVKADNPASERDVDGHVHRYGFYNLLSPLV